MTANIKKGNGYGFTRKDGGIAMQSCFECGKENWAMAVYSGCCAWCGHDANEHQQGNGEE